MNTFWALVENDLRFSKRHQHEHYKWLKWLGSLVFLCYLMVIPYSAAPQVVLPFIPLITLALCVGQALRSIKQEWRYRTAAWWLTLPYSRFTLICAKLIAVLIRAFRITLVMFTGVLIAGIIGFIVNPSLWNINFVSSALKTTATLYLIFLFWIPALITFSLTLGVTIVSKLKPLAFVLWFGFIWTITFILNHFAPQFKKIGHAASPRQLVIPNISYSLDITTILINVALPLVFVVLLIMLANFLLDRFTEV